jgi:hypothetical protein
MLFVPFRSYTRRHNFCGFISCECFDTPGFIPLVRLYMNHLLSLSQVQYSAVLIMMAMDCSDIAVTKTNSYVNVNTNFCGT